MKAEELPYSLDYMVTEVKPKTLYETQSDIRQRHWSRLLIIRYQKMEAETLGNKNGKVKVNALLNSVLDMQASD